MANMFDENGNYNKTEWKPGDRITAGKLNKIEESLEAINNNDIERHKEADERLDALEEQKEAVEERFDELEDLVADNKTEVDTAIYEVHSKMDRLEQEMNDGIDTVEAIAHTVDDKIAEADVSMKAQVAEVEDIVDQGKVDINAIIDEVEKISDLEAINEQLTHITIRDRYINVIDYGAFSDNTNEDITTEAIKEAINSNTGGILYFPNGSYAINDTINIPSAFTIKNEGIIVYYGETNKPALHFTRQVQKTLDVGIVRYKDRAFHGWTDESFVGIVFENMFKCDIKVMNVINFTVGVRIMASGGLSVGHFFNDYNIVSLEDNKIQLEFYQDGVQSWINSNKFRNISFTLTRVNDSSNSMYGFANAVVDRYCIKQTFVNDNEYPADTNIFENLKFDLGSGVQGTYTAIHLQKALQWEFHYRTELVAGSNVKFAVLDLQYNLIRNIRFYPIVELSSHPNNIAIILENMNGNVKYNPTEIYEKYGKDSNMSSYEIFRSDKFNERARIYNNNHLQIDNMYWMQYNKDTLSEMSYEWNSSAINIDDKLVENGVKIGTYYCGVYYIKNIKQFEEFSVTLINSCGDNSKNQVLIKCFDSDGNAMSEFSSDGLRNILHTNLYYESTGKNFKQSVISGVMQFGVGSNEVKTIAVLFSGHINGVVIKSNFNNASVLKSCITNRNNSKEHLH